jgi:hypothetical protein
MKRIKEKLEGLNRERARPRPKVRTARSAEVPVRISVWSEAAAWSIPVIQARAALQPTESRHIVLVEDEVHGAIRDKRTTGTRFDIARRLATEVVRFLSNFRHAIA